MLTRIKQLLGRNRRSDPAITIDSDGFGYETSKGEMCRIPWNDIQEIRAYKLDLLTVDEVRFAFQMDGWWADVSEEQPGFDRLVKQLEQRFPSVAGWQERVIKPAFAPNETILYE